MYWPYGSQHIYRDVKARDNSAIFKITARAWSTPFEAAWRYKDGEKLKLVDP